MLIIGIILIGCHNTGTDRLTSSGKAITAFSFSSPAAIGTIDEDGKTITVIVPYGSDVTSLVPTITYTGKSINPDSEVSQNFSNQVAYTVTAEDDSTSVYTVSISKSGLTGLSKLEVVKLPSKTSYLIGENLDFGDMVVKGTYVDGSVKVEKTYSINKCDTFSSGTKSVIINLDNQTATFDISIENNLIDTGLPVVYIATDNRQPIDSEEVYINANMIIKYNYLIVNENTIRIRGRGHATWGYPKKPYKIKLDNEATLLGMGKDKNWELLANYCDKTLMRTSVGFKVSELLNFPWTPKAKYVELVINGEYLGNYQLVEGITRGANRVDIPKKGFLIEKDNYYLQEPVFFTTNRGYGYSFKNPEADDLTNEQLSYIKNYINEFESILDSDKYADQDNGHQKYIDVDSFVKWFLFQQIIANMDTNVYLLKSDSIDSKLFMGPVWDFEWSMGIGWYYGSRPRPASYFVWRGDEFYYGKLIQYATFKDKLKQIWNENHQSIQKELLLYMDSKKKEIMKSQELNFKRWDILRSWISVGGEPLGTFEKEVDCDKQFFINHMMWLEMAINGL
jgi:hypothetical protein